MAKEKNAAANSFFQELFQTNVYKRSQGRITRQVTFAAIAIVMAIGAWRFNVYMLDRDQLIRVVLPSVAVLVGWWVAFRLVNMPSFADFLIAVEVEMNKVSWPSRSELIRSSMVVIFSIIFLAVILFGYDLFWRFLLTTLRVLNPGAA